jgi:hypothetical protein
MTKEFIPYQQALALKELGFDEHCLAFYGGDGDSKVYYNSLRNGSGDYEPYKANERLKWFGAPLYQQAFRFFREKYDLVHEISWSKYKGGLNFDYDIFSLVLPTDDELGDEDDVASDKSMETYDSLVDKGFRHHESNTYEEAELTCLIKLIEIVKDGKSKSNS